jgi:hypothetical protein
MDRRLIFPAVAITAWAQQPAPSPAAAEAEAALRARVGQFYQLQVDKKFRQAEALVADDTKDDYYNGGRPNIKSFEIKDIELLDNNTRARVVVKRKITMVASIGTMDFDTPSTTSWKIENGQWVWYIDHNAPLVTPFGAIVPRRGDGQGPVEPPTGKVDLATLMSQVVIDGTSVILSPSDPERTITVSNHLPGPVTLKLENPGLDGIVVELEKTALKSGEKSGIRFHLTGDGDAKSSGVVRLIASPIGRVFEIQVQSK